MAPPDREGALQEGTGRRRLGELEVQPAQPVQRGCHPKMVGPVYALVETERLRGRLHGGTRLTALEQMLRALVQAPCSLEIALLGSRGREEKRRDQQRR